MDDESGESMEPMEEVPLIQLGEAVFVSIMPSAVTCRVCVLQAREYSRKAVSASACLSADSDRFSRQLVDFLKLCENVNSTAPPTE